MRKIFFALFLLTSVLLHSQEESHKFSSDSVKYTVDNFFLGRAIKEKVLLVPEVRPTLTGGQEVVEAYFKNKPLVDTKPRDSSFLVHIGFVVDTKGECRDFKILSLGQGPLAIAAEEILGRAKEMPVKWNPATENGQAVDCIQLITFTVENGLIAYVGYHD